MNRRPTPRLLLVLLLLLALPGLPAVVLSGWPIAGAAAPPEPALQESATARPPAVTAVAWHPVGKSLACAVGEQLHLFDAQGKPLPQVAKLAGRITALRFAPNGRYLAAAHGLPGRPALVSLLPLTPQGGLAGTTPACVLSGPADALYALEFHPVGTLLAAAGYDRVVYLWQVPAEAEAQPQPPRQPLRSLRDHSDAVYGLSFHPRGHLLATAGADRAVKVWRIADGQRLYTLGEMTDWVYAVAWHPDGKHLVAGGADRTLRLWQAGEQGGRLLASIFAHEKPIWRLAFAQAGELLYSLGEDGVIKQWTLPRLAERRTLPAQPETVLDLAVHPGQARLLLGRFDGRALLLDEAGRPLQQLLPLPPQPLQIDSLTPEAVIRGQKVRLLVRGRNLEQLRRISAASPAVRLHWKPADLTADEAVVEAEIAPQAAVGPVVLEFSGVVGPPARRTLFIDRFPLVVERGSGDAARHAEAIALPAAIAGVIDRPGDEDYFRFTLRAGEPLGVQVLTAELGSKLSPWLSLLDANGRLLAEGERYLGAVAPHEGVYVLAIRDQQFRGGRDFAYRLQVGPVPVVMGVFPLAVPRGKTTAVQVRGVHLGEDKQWRTEATVPAEATAGTWWKVPLPQLLEPPLGEARVLVDELEGQPIDPQRGTVDLELGEAGRAADGILAAPGSQHLIRFRARQGETWVLDVLARRAGSPVDSVIEVLDAEGRPVPRAVLRPVAVIYTTFRDHDATSPGIRLESWNDLAIDDYLYAHGELMRVLALPRNPDDDCQFYQFAGRRLAFLGTTPAVHPQGTPLYKVEIHPPGSAFPPNGLPLLTLYYRNDDGGPEYGKDSFLLFTAPHTGLYQVRIADVRGAGSPDYAYRLRIRRPRPDFDVQMRPSRPVLWRGGGASLNVQITRRDGFDGPVQLRFVDLPPGLSSPPSFVEGGQFATAVAVAATPDAHLPEGFRLRLQARAVIAGQEVVREALSEPLGPSDLRPPADLICRPLAHTLTIRPGQESRFAVEIERLGGFRGRVPLEVRGLPHGVRVLHVGLNGILITESETRREVVLYAEPWVQPMEHPIVVLARHEGKGTEHAAPSLLLKVEK